MILTIGYRKRETDIRAISSWNSRDSFATSVATSVSFEEGISRETNDSFL